MNQTAPPVRGNGRQDLTGRPSLSFDYGAKTVNFGRGLDKAEARAVIDVLKKAIPSVFKTPENS
ncbi:MAG: hypothetical protein R3D34_12925 [Nitratireductor sp.]